MELFHLEDGGILLNEIAPRPHNSGHYTIEACACCQYQNHVRAILGWPLGDTSLRVGGAVMKNILGDGDGPEAMQRMHDVMGAALQVPGANVHWYDKPEARAGRKMGHLTVTAPHAAEARARLDQIMAIAVGAGRFKLNSSFLTHELERRRRLVANSLKHVIHFKKIAFK